METNSFISFLTKRKTRETPICAIASPYKFCLADPRKVFRTCPSRNFMSLIRPSKQLNDRSLLSVKLSSPSHSSITPDLLQKESTKYLCNVTKAVSIKELQRLDYENSALRQQLLLTSSQACLSLDRLQTFKAQSKSAMWAHTRRSATQLSSAKTPLSIGTDFTSRSKDTTKSRCKPQHVSVRGLRSS
jgi:hypothetical protein